MLARRIPHSAQRLTRCTPMLDFSMRAFHSKAPDTRPAPTLAPLPTPFGPLTQWIRDLYALDILSRVAAVLSNPTLSNYTDKVSVISTKRDDQTIAALWGDFGRLIQEYGEYYQLSRQREFIRARVPENFVLTEAVLARALHALIPRNGSIKVEHFARIVFQAKPDALTAVFRASKAISETFVLQKNLQDVEFIRRGADSVIFDGWGSLGGNKAVAFCLEAAAMLLPAIPDFWVPYEACLAHVADPELIKTRNFFRSADVLDGGIEQGIFNRTLTTFVRRTPRLAGLPGIPPCALDAAFARFHVPPRRALKIAFCIPAAPTPLDKVHMFPSVLAWAQTTPFTLFDVVTMFPDAMLILPGRMLQSTLRERYPIMGPEPGTEGDAAAEELFDARLAENPEIEKELLGYVSQANSRSFWDARKHHDKSCSKIRRRAQVEQELQTAETMPDEAIMREATERVGEMGMSVDALIEAIAAALPEARRAAFTRTIELKHGRKLHVLIEKHPQFDLVATEERVAGTNGYAYVISRRAAGTPVGNRFLDPAELHAELRFQMKAAFEAQRSRGDHLRGDHLPRVNLSRVISNLPYKARLAIRKFGGFAQFIQDYPMAGVEVLDEMWLHVK